MIGNPVHEAQRRLVAGQQATIQRRVKTEPDRIDHILQTGFDRLVLNHIAVQIAFHQTGGCHLLKEMTVPVNQNMVFRSRNSRRHMGEDHIGHTEIIDQAISRRQIDPDLPFSFGNLATQ